MPVIGSVGALQTSKANPYYTAGIIRERFNVGYFADDFTWFDTRTPDATATQTTEIDVTTGTTDSVRWRGYWLASSTETYTFFTNSDDSSVMWIGGIAKQDTSDLTTANATVNNSGAHVVRERSGTFAMTAGIYYPILIMYGNNTGPSTFDFNFSTPTITKTTNVTGYVFRNANTDAL